MVPRPDREWIAGQLSTLMEHTDSLTAIHSETVNEYRPLTALKLIVLSAGLDMYTNIAPKRYDHCYYLDLFAGAGATQINNREESVVGSPVLAPMLSEPDFRAYHFVDSEESVVQALKERIRVMDGRVDAFPGDRCHVHHQDANKFAHSFLDSLEDEVGPSYEGVNLFTFIDPEGLDPRWDVTERIANLFGDLLINFPKLGANRSIGKAKAREYFSTSAVENVRTEDQRREFYEEQLKSCGNTDITVPIRINSGSSGQHFHYDLIYATRRTPDGSPYVDAMRSMQTKMGVLDGDDIDHVMDTISGDVQALSGILPDEGEVKEDSQDRDGSQTGLWDFT